MSKEFLNVNTIITDASCFILLDKIEGLGILKQLYSHIFSTPEIAAEFGKRLPQWVNVHAVNNRDLLNTYAEIVDMGEASALALAAEVSSPYLILDDPKARKLAMHLNLEFIGTIGVLILAKEQNIIPSLRLYFERIRETDFRISPDFLEDLLNKYEK